MRRSNRKISQVTFNKSLFAEKEVQEKLTLWILRMILKNGGFSQFVRAGRHFYNDDLASFLGLERFVDTDDFNVDEILEILKSDLARLERKKSFTTLPILAKNIKRLSSLMELNLYEEQVLEFVVFLKQYDVLSNCGDVFGNELNSNQVKKLLSKILNIPINEIIKAFESGSRFSKSSIVTIYKRNTNGFGNKFEVVNDTFADNMFNLDQDVDVMFKEVIRGCEAAKLSLDDYAHIQKDIDILVPYMNNAVFSAVTGVNILLYGLPGTGKTELVKTIAEQLHVKLYEISYADADDESIDGRNRLKAYKMAQSLLSSKNSLIMYDEAEDIFESGGGFFAPQRQKDKAWINRILEINTIPTIWISNNINAIDNAIVRRFDMAIEVPIPKKQKREEIIRQYSENLLDQQTISKLAEHEKIAPALISRAAKVVSCIDSKESSQAFEQIINNTLKAQGYKELQECVGNSLPSNYNPDYVNCNTDLTKLAQGINATQNARLCLYGPAGTGKSAFGRYIAETLDKPLLLKKGSDLLSMYVGGTEKNIARAFREAKEEGAVLVFDEVDSFLADRTSANKNWEITQVNEMLVQMENFEGIFIATTNLIDNLDRASLRRFDLKMEFSYLKSEQAWNMFHSYCEVLDLSKSRTSLKDSVMDLSHLTPGDFAAVVRQNRFRPITDSKDLLLRLQDEIAVKNIESGKKMGFL